MVQVPSELVVTVWLPPLPVVVLDVTVPLPECMVMPFGPVVWAETVPFPAWTDVDKVVDAPGGGPSRSTILQFLSLCADAE